MRGNGQHLATQRLDQLTELTLRVQDKDIIFCAQGDLHQFLFCTHALAAARHAQPERMTVEQLCPVNADHIARHRVLPIVDAVCVVQLLCLERHQHSNAFCGQCAQRMDAPHAIRQHCVQAVPLLPAQGRKLAQMLAAYRQQAFRIRVQLLLCTCQMHHRHKAVHHALVAFGQVIQKFRCFLTLELHIVGNIRRVIVGIVLTPLPVGHVRFHTKKLVLQFPHGFVRGHRQDVDGHHHAAVQFAQLHDEIILDEAGIIL